LSGAFKTRPNLDFVHFLQMQGIDSVASLFSMSGFLNIRLNPRRLKSSVVENKVLTNTTTGHL
ncbi:MAG: hypothetical protein KF868_03245, partial [Acidobacteria bacterium]|nr:hypothetical protein [Acidobacteriota bacterium]